MTTSTTILTAEQVQAIADKYGIQPWTKKGAPRYYLNADALAEIIGLDQTFYKTGSCSGCSYIDLSGHEVSVAHSRAYGSGYYACKTYICEGRVYCDWEPYGEDIAELVAVRIAEMCGVDPDAGEVEEKYEVAAATDGYMAYYKDTVEDAEQTRAELSEKYPDRGYSVRHVMVGKRTRRVRPIQ